ncbi:MAG TPA: hypothetical protein VED01_14010 [Burkholderiales bacterium]|nr:hypothetical protein [Burkholderiales bacterium]
MPAAALWTALLVFAFVAAPHSCAWGLSAYFWSGIAVVAISASLPSLVDAKEKPRLGVSALLGAAAAGVWIIGLFAAPFQLLCRLF